MKKKSILSYALLTIGGLGVLAGISGAVLALERNSGNWKDKINGGNSDTSQVTPPSDSSSSSTPGSSSSEEPIPEEKQIAIIGLSDFMCTEAEDDNGSIFMPFSIESVGINTDSCTATIQIPEGCKVANSIHNIEITQSGPIDLSIKNYMLICPKPGDSDEIEYEITVNVTDEGQSVTDSVAFKLFGKEATPAYDLKVRFDEFECTARNGTDMCEMPFSIETSLSELADYSVSFDLVGHDGHIVNYCYIEDEEGNNHCTACGMCERACPNASINVLPTKNIAGKKVLGRYVYHFASCTQCGLCVEACPFGAIRMAPEFEVATTDPNTLEMILNKKEGQG